MKAVIQRVLSAKLSVNNKVISKIDKGLVVFLGVAMGDCEKEALLLANKIAKLRIFEDMNGKMNLSLKDVSAQVLLVSQFTLFGDCSQGNRPSFFKAEKPAQAKKLYEKTLLLLREMNIPTFPGVFGEDMKIEQVNDGPVTIIIDSSDLIK